MLHWHEHPVTVRSGRQPLGADDHPAQLGLDEVAGVFGQRPVAGHQAAAEVAEPVPDGLDPLRAGEELQGLHEVAVVVVTLGLVGEGVHLERRGAEQEQPGVAVVEQLAGQLGPRRRRRSIEVLEPLELVEDDQVRLEAA